MELLYNILHKEINKNWLKRKNIILAPQQGQQIFFFNKAIKKKKLKSYKVYEMSSFIQKKLYKSA